MIKSMTGYGRGRYDNDGKEINVEIKSVNHKYHDISVKMPKSISYLEEYVKKRINETVSRGKIDVFINITDYENKENQRINRFDNKYYNGYNINLYEPSDDFNTAEFIIINLIGQGTFGKIYCVQWIKNNKLYAMKKLELESPEELKEFQGKVKMVKNLYKKTNHCGFVRILGDKFIPLYDYKIYCNYYIIMELGERDWEKDIQVRFLHQKYYSEYELYQIIYQLVKTLSLMQRYNVSHRDIKPQNILIINGNYLSIAL